MDKWCTTATEAVADVQDGSTVAVGGFGLCGAPLALIEALCSGPAKDIHLVTNNCGPDGVGLSRLLARGRVRRVTASYIGDNHEFLSKYLDGTITVELIPQGTLAEKLRCGGSGIPAFYTPTGAETLLAAGRMPIR